ncbi:hypothetical protein A1O1_01330 [Capronia coronata CBS 617.96]|uniref:Uncharacterized protein n=1 Tax=Capronia coronata CBS 617.96 TaxID=1182541 RepID=W9ZNX6_9EURO|nr:uncharacterized protein A1O1_01330 [Capronia coronata CBS 617.96]EXJ96204.1 hypothetical protein A1O1_01330 [Capronia coronata CBS 617.96]
MPLATIHLISLTQETSLISFLQTLKATTTLHPLVISKVIRWIITPTKIDTGELLNTSQPWDLLVILLADTTAHPETEIKTKTSTPTSTKTKTPLLQNPLRSQISQHWSTTAGIPSRLTRDFAISTNPQLLHPDPSSVPALTGALDNPRIGKSAQTLELSAELARWIESFAETRAGRNPLSMLNLLAFKAGMKESYLKYGKAFGESIGRRRGGVAKLVGNVVIDQRDQQAEEDAKSGSSWHEFALASYPSILHFADMLASEDYQAVNLKYRVPALEDTCILCTSEIEIEDLLAGNDDNVGTASSNSQTVKVTAKL